LALNTVAAEVFWGKYSGGLDTSGTALITRTQDRNAVIENNFIFNTEILQLHEIHQ
jgi:hypothetical protein